MGGSNPEPRRVDRRFRLRGAQKIQSLKDPESKFLRLSLNKKIKWGKKNQLLFFLWLASML